MNNAAYLRGGNFCFGASGLAEGTNAATLKTAAAADYCIDGILYTKAITDNIAMTAAAEQADLTTCLYLVSIDSAGAVTVTKGDEVLTADLGVNGVSAFWPECPAGHAPLGGLKIVMSGGTFTSGTTDLSGTGVTATAFDLANVPVGGVSA